MSAKPEAGGWSQWPAPAKLNLFLHITGRRPDGYHCLQTVFRLLDWGDTVRLRVRKDGVVERHGPSAEGVAAGDDLMVKAAILLRKSSKTSLGADISVQKRIPAGGGFGGGSSDAATVLVALNRLWGLEFASQQLAELGLALGADVPVFVHGRSAWAEGVGQILQPLELPEAHYLLVDPGLHVPTGELFQAADLTRNAAPAKISDFVLGNVLGNAFEPVLRRREPVIESVFTVLSRFGTPRLTGSGSGCFVEFTDRASAEAALADLPDGLLAWTATGVNRSPLHVALANEFLTLGRRQEA